MQASRYRAWRRPLAQRTWRVPAAALLTGVLALTAACGGGASAPSWQSGKPAEGPKASVTITAPAADATDVPTVTEIAFTVSDAEQTTVEVADTAGKAVKGTLGADGTTWVPDKRLAYSTTYIATVTATGDDGKPATATTTFTTMAEPKNQVRVMSFLADDQVVGVAMPLIIQFSRAIPEEYRDDVQRRMSVRADPPQEGIWHWSSPTEVRYRPKEFWKSGTKIRYRIQAAGLPMGDGWYGRNDLTVDLTIGRELIMTVENRTKQMIVRRDGQVLKSLPVSLGKPKTPSSSGTMVIMERLRETVFDTMDAPDPENRYRLDIEYAQRLTWGGEFIHAAPWSVADQGVRNVSHGCINLSQENARWLFEQTLLGDPVIVTGTEVKLRNGNGWTDWNLSWEEYVKGSALPYQPADDASGDVEPTPTA
jgi:lipoprotein-anchoring transpeptidase ErfK/SrfK